jgi:hypothetical protein
VSIVKAAVAWPIKVDTVLPFSLPAMSAVAKE